jgi:hypothetical protein
MAEMEERKPFADGLEIRVVANGFSALPWPSRYREGHATYNGDIYVFRNASELAAWILQLYPEAK